LFLPVLKFIQKSDFCLPVPGYSRSVPAAISGGQGASPAVTFTLRRIFRQTNLSHAVAISLQ